jgi:hypothetical protein
MQECKSRANLPAQVRPMFEKMSTANITHSSVAVAEGVWQFCRAFLPPPESLDRLSQLPSRSP